MELYKVLTIVIGISGAIGGLIAWIISLVRNSGKDEKELEVKITAVATSSSSAHKRINEVWEKIDEMETTRRAECQNHESRFIRELDMVRKSIDDNNKAVQTLTTIIIERLPKPKDK